MPLKKTLNMSSTVLLPAIGSQVNSSSASEAPRQELALREAGRPSASASCGVRSLQGGGGRGEDMCMLAIGSATV